MDMKVKPNTKQEIAVAISAPKFGTLEILLNGRAPLVVERFSKKAELMAKMAEEELEKLNVKKADYEIDVREGGRTRCEGFCQVAPFCDQYKQYLANKGK